MTERKNKMMRSTAEIKEQRELAPGICDMVLRAPEIARDAVPGQFVNLFVGDGAHILPRPISLAGIDREAGTLRLVYRVSGVGTRMFSTLTAGDSIDLLGPLGNGFPLNEAKGKRVLLVGGGIGIPPLLEVAHALSEAGAMQPADEDEGPQSVTAILGYRDAQTFLAEEYAAYATEICIVTEDGSTGTQGTVLDGLRAMPKEDAAEETILFACGPAPMLRALQEYTKEEGIPAWLSLEERMACGIGACLACVCKTADVDSHSKVHNRRVCKDGPVFPAEEILL